jgi:hypothetical protein
MKILAGYAMNKTGQASERAPYYLFFIHER